jgi:hypothetical protein
MNEDDRYTRYRHLAIESASAAPTERELMDIEALLGRPLPESFKAYLAVANGGTLEYVIDVPVAEGKTEALSFSTLYSTKKGTEGTFLGAIRKARTDAAFPTSMLPFADDGGSSVVFLDLSDEGKGRVVLLAAGLPKWIEKREGEAFFEIAPSFDAYVARLRIDRELIFDQLENDVEEPEHVDIVTAFLDIGMPRWREEDEELVGAVEDARERLTEES